MSSFNFSRPCLIGILNLTPDSFSDGGDYNADAAVARATEMVEQGAAIIDIGGESTRPGAERVPADEQKRRIVPAIKAISAALPDTPISVDTTLSEVAVAALDAGAGMVNDISAGRDDAEFLHLVAEKSVPICLMHMQNNPQTMQDAPHYQDVLTEVCDFLYMRAGIAMQSGVMQNQIILDPGIGFGKTLEHNLILLANLKRIVDLGFPVLLGTSRKRFIDSIYQSSDPKKRVAGGCATTVIGLVAGVKLFRVHDVFEHRQALEVTGAIRTYCQ